MTCTTEAPGKACTNCGLWKELGEFNRHSKAPDGLQWECKTCTREYNREWGKANRDKTQITQNRWRKANQERYKGYLRKYHKDNPTSRLISNAKARAKEKGLAFDLNLYKSEIQSRVAMGLCETTGLPFNFDARGHMSWDSPSLDQIEAGGGYPYPNVRVVLWADNSARGDWGDDIADLVAIARLRKKGYTVTPPEGVTCPLA